MRRRPLLRCHQSCVAALYCDAINHASQPFFVRRRSPLLRYRRQSLHFHPLARRRRIDFWKKKHDAKYNHDYYVNGLTSEKSWAPIAGWPRPAPPFPPPAV